MPPRMLRVDRDSRTLDLLIGGVRMTSHPDISLRLATKTSDKKDPEIEVVVEVGAGSIDQTRNHVDTDTAPSVSEKTTN